VRRSSRWLAVFEELGSSSARQALIRLREDGILLPRRANGSQRITWAPATYPAIHDLVVSLVSGLAR
jgi:hypothetical protein